MMRHSLLLTALCAVLVSGCALPPGNPGILVDTTPPGASCTVSRQGQPIATVAPTPGIALIEPAAGEITIQCSRQGFAESGVTLPSRDAGAGFGAILFGGAPDPTPLRVDIVLTPRPGGLAPRDLRPR